MNDYVTTCQLCNEEYNNYMRTFYVQENDIKIRVCLDCRKDFCNNKHIYTNHIPPMCDGGDIVTHCFETEEELLDYILSSTKEGYICCMDKRGTIVDVATNEKFWWVRGYSTLHSDELPDWQEKVKELYGDV